MIVIKEIFKKKPTGFIKMGERWERRVREMSKKIIPHQTAFINLYSGKMKKNIGKFGDHIENKSDNLKKSEGNKK